MPLVLDVPTGALLYGGTEVLRIDSLGGDDYSTFDHVTLSITTAVPEPATITMMMVALGVAAIRVLRRAR
jgi:hypothetical protein